MRELTDIEVQEASGGAVPVIAWYAAVGVISFFAGMWKVNELIAINTERALTDINLFCDPSAGPVSYEATAFGYSVSCTLLY